MFDWHAAPSMDAGKFNSKKWICYKEYVKSATCGNELIFSRRTVIQIISGFKSVLSTVTNQHRKTGVDELFLKLSESL